MRRSPGFAPAKLNLYLHVTGRRRDGFHMLDGLVAFATVGDALTVSPAPALSLTVGGPFAPSLDGMPSDNLVWRAAALLAERLEIEPNVAIRLVKNLPVASGIGGGSSDAAACLRLLAAHWKCDDYEMLLELASFLGSDVPACLWAEPLWLGATGELLEPAGSLPACGVVLVNPNIKLPTPPVYRAFRGPFSAADRFDIPQDPRAFATALTVRHNDLTAPAIGLVPAIRTVLAALERIDTCLLARMSGSGATCFGLFATHEEATAAANVISADHGDWWVAAATLSSDGGAVSAEPGSSA